MGDDHYQTPLRQPHQATTLHSQGFILHAVPLTSREIFFCGMGTGFVYQVSMEEGGVFLTSSRSTTVGLCLF